MGHLSVTKIKNHWFSNWCILAGTLSQLHQRLNLCRYYDLGQFSKKGSQNDANDSKSDWFTPTTCGTRSDWSKRFTYEHQVENL